MEAAEVDSIYAEATREVLRGRTDSYSIQRYNARLSISHDGPTGQSCIFRPRSCVNDVPTGVGGQELVWPSSRDLVGYGEGEGEGIEGEVVEKYRVEGSGEDVVNSWGSGFPEAWKRWLRESSQRGDGGSARRTDAVLHRGEKVEPRIRI